MSLSQPLKSTQAVRDMAAKLLKAVHDTDQFPMVPPSTDENDYRRVARHTKAAKLLKQEGHIRLSSECRLVLTEKGRDHIKKFGFVVYPT